MNLLTRLTCSSLLAFACAACDSDFETKDLVVDKNNIAPSIADQVFSTDEDVPLDAVIVATDADGDPITFHHVVGSGPTQGRLESFDTASGAFQFVPSRDFTGRSTFQVTVRDGRGGESTATIAIDVDCPNSPNQCGWDKFDAVGGPGAGEPSIAVDTAVRVSVALLQDNSAQGGSNSDLFVFRTDPIGRSFAKLPGSGADGALNDIGEAGRPDLLSSVVVPTTIAVAWDEADSIVMESRNDVAGSWVNVSGTPNAVAAVDPAATIDQISGSPLLVWTSTANAPDTDVRFASNSGNSISFPGNWQTFSTPLDISASNPSSRPAIATDDIPGGGANVAGRSNIAWVEQIGGIGHIHVRQCVNPSAGDIANCAQLGAALNDNPAVDASEPAITVPNSAIEGQTAGGDPMNPRPVVAFVENGSLFVKRYDPDSNSWPKLDDTGADGRLNVSTSGVAANPSIVTDVLGRYTVAWSETNAVDGSVYVYAKRFNATAGGPWTLIGGALNCDPVSGKATAPDITVDSTGRPYIAFEETDPSGVSQVVVLSFES